MTSVPLPGSRTVVRTKPVRFAPPPTTRLGGVSSELVLHVALALAGSVALTWLVYERLVTVTGTIGFWLVAYGFFLALFATISATTLDRGGVVDRLVGALVTSAGLVLVSLLVGIVVFTAYRGREALTHWNFFHETMSGVQPDAGLDRGGIYAAMVGTLEQIGISVVLSVPLGVATAVYLSEVGGRLARLVRSIVEAMSAVPTIVAGLFIYTLLVVPHEYPGWLATIWTHIPLTEHIPHERSGFAASLALVISMLPVVCMTAEVVLRLVPGGLREASLALGTTRLQTIWKVVLPTARPGLVTAVLLGVARVIGETSPILLVSSYTPDLNYDPMHNAQVSLPFYVFNQMRQPLDAQVARAFGAGVVLLGTVVVLFAFARIIGGRAPGQLSGRQRRRLARSMAEVTALDTLSPATSVPASGTPLQGEPS